MAAISLSSAMAVSSCLSRRCFYSLHLFPRRYSSLPSSLPSDSPRTFSTAAALRLQIPRDSRGVCSSSTRSEYNRVVVEAAREEPEEGVVHIQFDSEIGASNTAVEQPRSPPQSRSFFPKKGQDLELECESLAYKGLGVCKVVETGFVVFCERALPGERLVARIVKKRKGFAEAYKLKTLSVHNNAVTAPCKYFGECGGCKAQNLAYEAQLQAKEQQVHDLVARVGKFGRSAPVDHPDSYMMPIVPCLSQYHYRNKMEFSYGTKKWRRVGEYMTASKEAENVDPKVMEFALGLHAPGRFDKVLPIDHCLLQHDISNQVLAMIQEFGEKNVHQLPPYDVRTHEGFLKHLIIRSGR